MKSGKTFKLTTFGGALLAIVLCANCRGDAGDVEYQVKAAFIYNFTQFVQWPADAFATGEKRFVIGVLGNSPVSAILSQKLRGKVVGDRPIVLEEYPSDDKIGHCQLLFVSRAAGSSEGVARALHNAPVLLVGEGDQFMTEGGAIRLFIEENKMRFEVDPAALAAARLKASAKLMKLARIYSK